MPFYINNALKAVVPGEYIPRSIFQLLANTGVAPEGKLELRRGTRKGQRVVVVHALGSEGELRAGVDNGSPALMTWQYPKDRGGGDYHDTMNSDRFKEWAEDFSFLHISTCTKIGKQQILQCWYWTMHRVIVLKW